MNAMILAAGKGSRLGERTIDMPKPMIEVNGKPILEKNIFMCKNIGITKIFINLFHLPQKIMDYFGDGSKYGVEIKYNLEDVLFGTAGAILGFKEDLIKKPFFVIYGDNYTDFDLNILRQFNEEHHADMSILFHKRDDISGSGIANFSKNNRLLDFVEKPSVSKKIPGWVNTGIYYIFNTEIINKIRLFDDFAHDFIPTLIEQKYRIFGLRKDVDLLAVDTPDLLNQVIK